MDIYHLKTFVAVAQEGSITRASERLHLSQPAVSAHIKAVEDALGVTLFERTPRGMSATRDGQRLLEKAEQTIAAHQELVNEASRLKGRLTGQLRVGAPSNSNNDVVGRWLTALAERCPEVDVVVRHGTSADVLKGLRDRSLDVGFYNEVGAPEGDLMTVEVGRFGVWVVAAPGVVPPSAPLDWAALAERPWVYPTASACCGQTAENLFAQHHIRPARIVSVDREDVTRTLVAGGVGVGLLHTDTAQQARARGEVELVIECPTAVRVLYAQLASRAHDPLLSAATALVHPTVTG